MSVLIKGMEMPENCDDCFLGDFYCEKCQHIDGYKMAGSRPFDCPLIEVPTPHGRLIDADEAVMLLQKYYDRVGEPLKEHAIGECIMIIKDDVSTIIEAEVPKE